jgi:hypothetical protein
MLNGRLVFATTKLIRSVLVILAPLVLWRLCRDIEPVVIALLVAVAWLNRWNPCSTRSGLIPLNRSLAVGAVCLSLILPGLGRTASIDCKASNISPLEQTVCSDKELSERASKVELLYKRARALTNDSDLLAAQRDWIEERNQCGVDKQCLLRTYLRREGELVDFVAVRAPDPGIPECPEAGTLRPTCVVKLISALAQSPNAAVRWSASDRLQHWLTDNGQDTCQSSDVVENHLLDVLKSLKDPNRGIVQNTLDILGRRFSGDKTLPCCMSVPHRNVVTAALKDFKTNHPGYGSRPDEAISNDSECGSN